MTYYPSKPEIERLKQSVYEHAEELRRKIFFGDATTEEKDLLYALNRVIHAVKQPGTPDAAKYELLRRALKDGMTGR